MQAPCQLSYTPRIETCQHLTYSYHTPTKKHANTVCLYSTWCKHGTIVAYPVIPDNNVIHKCHMHQTPDNNVTSPCYLTSQQSISHHETETEPTGVETFLVLRAAVILFRSHHFTKLFQNQDRHHSGPQ